MVLLDVLFDCVQAEYSLLANRLSEYVVRLLDKVHGNNELNAILNGTDSATDDATSRTPNELARLQLAIEYKEKRVGRRQNKQFPVVSRLALTV